MPKDFSRTSRLGEQIQRELATMIQFDMKDPRLGMVTLNRFGLPRIWAMPISTLPSWVLGGRRTRKFVIKPSPS